MSRLVGTAMPEIILRPILPTHAGVVPRGEARMINLFASWCGPCAAEVGELQKLRAQGVRIEGIAVRDRADDLRAFLDRHGDPYAAIGGDPESRTMIALGASGVPETFIVDRGGIVRHHHVGAVGRQDVASLLAAWQAVGR